MGVWAGVFYKSGLMISSCQGENFTNVFVGQMKTINLYIFPNHGEIYTCR